MTRFNGMDEEEDWDWDQAFENELVCKPDRHKWETPITPGQKCLCGEVGWGI